MPEYVSKPQRVEAIQWTGENLDKVLAFNPDLREAADGTLLMMAGQDGAQGYVDVPVGHWIVRATGNLTDHWPVDPDYFARKYERVDAQDVLSRLSGDE